MSLQHIKTIRVSYIATLLLLGLGSSLSNAQSLSDLENRLDQLKREKTQQEASLKNLQTELGELPERVAEAEAELQQAEQQLLQDEKELQRLESLSSSGEDVSRDLNLQGHAVKMAARRVESKSRSLGRVRSNHDALQSDIDSAEAKILATDNQIAKHQQWIADKKAEQARERKLAEERKAAPPPAPKAAAPVVAQPAPKPAPKAIEPVVEPEPVALPEPEKKLAALSAADAAALESAREYLAKLDEYQKNNQSAFVRYDNLKLSGGKVGGNPKFEHIIYNQYRTEARIDSGIQFIEIGNRTFRIDVPEDATYIVYVDGTDPTRMQLVYFKKSLLDYL